MRYFTFDEKFAQGIVDGILQGYKDYLTVRKEKKEELEISSAYAWVKGNHIDDSVSHTVPEFGVTYQHSKAGYAWGYLQFTQEDKKVLFIIKNGMKHGTKIPSTRRENVEMNYLSKLARINKNADFNEQDESNKQSEQLSFDDFSFVDEILNDEVTQISNSYDRFFIVSYTTDENKMIAEIELLLPNPNQNILYKIDDWTQYIESSAVRIELDELQSIIDEKEPLLPNQTLFDYGIKDKTEEKKKE